MKSILSKWRRELRSLCPAEGSHPAGPSLLTAWRFTSRKIRMPQTENPYLYLVLDGVLRLHTPSGMLDYIAGQYSVSKIDTPLSGTVEFFSDQGDFLALALEFTASDVIACILDMDDDLTARILHASLTQREMRIADGAVISSVYRLFCAMQRTLPSAFLQKNILREILYFVLRGSCGKQLLQNITGLCNAEEIYEANSWIKQNFRDAFSVESLAQQRNMSVSLFHQKFKSAVGMGPVQCQKRLRLTEARRLMLDENRNVT